MYAASKAGADMLMKYAAIEVGPKNAFSSSGSSEGTNQVPTCRLRCKEDRPTQRRRFLRRIVTQELRMLRCVWRVSSVFVNCTTKQRLCALC